MPASDYGKFSAAVEARGCALIDVTLRKNWLGTIAGRLIRADGTPASAGIDLTLMALADGENGLPNPFADEVHTDDHGDYVFRNVPPGKYKVVVHRCCFPTPEVPYPAIYWPAGASEADGSEIVIDKSMDAQHYDFRLPPEVKSMAVSGQVLLPDRKPAPGSEVWLLKLPDHDDADGNVTCCGVVDQTQADSEGRFAFKIMEGIKYGLTTSIRGEPWSSEIVEISFGQAQNPIVLILEASNSSEESAVKAGSNALALPFLTAWARRG